MGLDRQDGHLASASITRKKGKLNSQAKARQKAFPSFKTSKIGLGNPGAIVSSTTSLIRKKKANAKLKKIPQKNKRHDADALAIHRYI